MNRYREDGWPLCPRCGGDTLVQGGGLDWSKPFSCVECEGEPLVHPVSRKLFPASWVVPRVAPGPVVFDARGYSIRKRMLLANRLSILPDMQRLEWGRCAESVTYWINRWVWTYDPREPADKRDNPFDLFAIQSLFMIWISELQRRSETTGLPSSGVCEKSRDQGASWLCVAYAVHKWLFSAGFSAGFGSLKLEQVDAIGDMDTLLEKARFIVRTIPNWMRPKGYVESKHATECKILNPENKSSITGEGGLNIGHGGRKSIFFVDEAARLPDSSKVDSGLSGNTNCVIYVSTPAGVGNGFYRKRFSGDFPVFTFHWRDDPRKDEAWAKEKRKEIGEVLWAEQYEIDYAASLEDICIPGKYVEAAVGLDLPVSEGPIVGGLDCSGLGDNKTVLIARRGPNVMDPVFWSGLGPTPASHKAADVFEKFGGSELNYDVSGLGIGYKSAWDSTERVLKFATIPINTGNPPDNTKWEKYGGKTSKELFTNKRAEFWWMMRERFEKTYEYVKQGVDHPVDELISIPRCPQLIQELSQPMITSNEANKKVMESKKTMRSRGVSSPDFADALILAFAPKPRKKRAVWW